MIIQCGNNGYDENFPFFVQIGYAASKDGIHWKKHPNNPVLKPGAPGTWDDNHVFTKCVLYNGNRYEMWYSGWDYTQWQIGYATSDDGIHWIKSTDNPILETGELGTWDAYHIYWPEVLRSDTEYSMWYMAPTFSPNNSTNPYGYATTSAKKALDWDTSLAQLAQRVFTVRVFNTEEHIKVDSLTRILPESAGIDLINVCNKLALAYSLNDEERSFESGTKDNGDNISRKRVVFSWEDSPKEMTVKDSLWHYYSMLHSSVLAIEPTTGQIKVWIGGNHFRYLPYDLVTSKRQTASAFKPILYGTAMENGFSPCEYLNNDSVGYENYPDWHPQNYDKKYGGEAALWYALSRSLNLPSIDLYFKLNPEDLQMQCQLFGLSISDEEQPSVALGSKEFSLYQMVMAYSAFANYGSIPQAFMINEIYDDSGELIYSSGIPQFEKALSKLTAWKMNKVLLNAVQEGTGKAIHSVYGIQSDIAGKTGTSQNYSDAWFFGYTENLVCGVWVGAMSPEVHFRSGTNGSGSRLALPIAGGMLHDIENDPGLRSKYLTGFNEMIDDTLYFNCEPFREPSFFEDLYQKKESSEKNETRKNKKESRKDKKEKKDSKFKSFFKRLFGKKDKGDK